MALINCVTESGEPFQIDSEILDQLRNNIEVEEALVTEADKHIDKLNRIMLDLQVIGSNMNLRVNYPSNKLVLYDKKEIHITPIDVATERLLRGTIGGLR